MLAIAEDEKQGLLAGSDFRVGQVALDFRQRLEQAGRVLTGHMAQHGRGHQGKAAGVDTGLGGTGRTGSQKAFQIGLASTKGYIEMNQAPV